MDALGICAGASSISVARASKTNTIAKIVWSQTKSHDGNVRQVILDILSEIEDPNELHFGVTGRRFRKLLDVPTISEPEAVEVAASFLLPQGHDYQTIISAGGETFMVYKLNESGKIETVNTGNKCASGTGDFLLQQLGRMDLNLDAMSDLQIPDEVYDVSGRCSVFCKSDCTHALNKGIEKTRVVAGLTKMMAYKCIELLKKLPSDKAVLIGGCSSNEFMANYLRENIRDLFIPDHANCFEAVGAALWALEEEPVSIDIDRIFKDNSINFAFLKPLKDYESMLEFKDHPSDSAVDGDVTILGLDVGSTTTKGILMRESDLAILASCYLRTNGDPIAASRRVYASLKEQLGNTSISISGLGVTGSGRAIAGIHAKTDAIINEIIAHATAAIHLDKEVDTIFEIGGQDAKYTYITGGVPSDYTMNEACSAGTGSFLEESAKESLGIDVEDIGKIAATSLKPLNFNDQCAAFISSDIKIAVQENSPLEDIVAGLVYSVCMNYSNRVKGNRPMGKKIFMQGGVCYNRAVPAAMAALTGKKIIVAPNPGLMGAFGVALESKNRIEQGLLQKTSFDLDTLINREIEHGKSFTCNGGKEKCDRRCKIARIVIDSTTYPFGGICNLWENTRKNIKVEKEKFDFVSWREKRCFRDLEKIEGNASDTRSVIGFNRSYLMHSYFPFFNKFFSALGFRIVVADTPLQEGFEQCGAAFCYPGEQAHAFWAGLLKQKLDYLFLPQITGVEIDVKDEQSTTCVLVQGEPYYLRSAFPQCDKYEVLSPIVNFGEPRDIIKAEMSNCVKALGVSKKASEDALEQAFQAQSDFQSDVREKGKQALEDMEKENESFAVVAFGRAYNAFTSDSNKGIPMKFASSAIRIIPYDMLPTDDIVIGKEMNMYWGIGRKILQASKYVKENPMLFGCYITNFSCGPDSFMVNYFRDIMSKKPSLTLELDSHTADAGLETRIEAFLDIVRCHLKTNKDSRETEKKKINGIHLEKRGKAGGLRVNENEWIPFSDKRVKFVLPSMGRLSGQFIAAAIRAIGYRVQVIPPSNEELLKIGRGNSSCKECLPLQLILGGVLDYLKKRPKDEFTVYMMPSTSGPCRFGQYSVLMKNVFEKLAIDNVVILTLTSIDGYSGLGAKFIINTWRGTVLGDIFEEIWSTILTAAKDKLQAKQAFNEEFSRIVNALSVSSKACSKQLKKSARVLSKIELTKTYSDFPKISLIGEIFVRHDPLSRQNLIERLAEKGFIVHTAPINEWIKYAAWLIKNGIHGNKGLDSVIASMIMSYIDSGIRKALAPVKMFHHHKVNINEIMRLGSSFVSSRLTGEAVLTVGSAFHDIQDFSCGVISIGPFGCMPSRIAEAILNEKFTTNMKAKLKGGKTGDRDSKMPFLAIETDGNPFPQIIEARLEAFILQAQRFHEENRKAGNLSRAI